MRSREGSEVSLGKCEVGSLRDGKVKVEDTVEPMKRIHQRLSQVRLLGPWAIEEERDQGWGAVIAAAVDYDDDGEQ